MRDEDQPDDRPAAMGLRRDRSAALDSLAADYAAADVSSMVTEAVPAGFQGNQ